MTTQSQDEVPPEDSAETEPHNSPRRFRQRIDHPTPDDVPSMARQLRFYKFVTILAVVVCAGALAWLAYLRHAGAPIQILIDGQAVATASDMPAANGLLLSAEDREVGANLPSEAFRPLQKIQFETAPRGTPVDTTDTAVTAIASRLKLHVDAYAILVDGHSSIALPTADLANQTLQAVKEHFEDLPPNAPLADDTDFVDDVKVQKMGVNASQVRTSPAVAAAYFWTPTHPKTYIVQFHDTGFGIAKKAHIAFSDFLAANSGHDMNRLKPGDVVNVAPMALSIHVRVTKRIQETEKIISDAAEQDAGKEEITYSVTYVNGQERGRHAVGLRTVSKPKVRYFL